MQRNRRKLRAKIEACHVRVEQNDMYNLAPADQHAMQAGNENFSALAFDVVPFFPLAERASRVKGLPCSSFALRLISTSSRSVLLYSSPVYSGRQSLDARR